ncbi:MAG: hypothetical protein COW30_15000 [Rhodospirillales bacterium CG15_BIG_FIL_POST_REV_8_21_14_020_66_15]|nr:MAG: hypothetical protein COW30_15000 [Rhodospirillales bacterium CG15_BIG_FIL_POST_REV_8_21_14_020_66_15]
MRIQPNPARTKAVFLDRDGVLNRSLVRDGKPLAPCRVEDFEIFADAHDALQTLKQKGFLLVVTTNQPDVGNGFVNGAVVERMHALLAARLPIDDIRVCYHSQSAGCACRKPKPGMILDAARELGIDLGSSYMVGDRWSDIEAGRAAGCRTVFIDRQYDEQRPDDADFDVRSIAEAASVICAATDADA